MKNCRFISIFIDIGKFRRLRYLNTYTCFCVHAYFYHTQMLATIRAEHIICSSKFFQEETKNNTYVMRPYPDFF